MGEVNVTENDILLKKVRLLNACKTEAQWRQLDPVLLSGEVAFTIAKKDENDILNSAVLGYKVGNGTSKWSELDYPSGDWNINAKSAETAKEAETAKTAANATVADTALKWKYDTKVYVALGTKDKNKKINARSSEDDDEAVSIGVDGVLGIENGGTGQSSFTKNTVLIINNDSKMQGTNLLDVSKGGTGKQSFTENYLIVGNGNNALKEIEILGVGHGGTGKKTFKSGYVLVGNENSGIEEIATYSEDVPKGELTGEQAKYIVTLGALKEYSGTSSISTVGTITNGTWKGSSIGANYGGTGLTKDEIGKANAVVITSGGDTNKLKIAESKAGAFYSTGNNNPPQFGTLKVAYGGTGSTTFTQNVPIFYNGTALESRNYFKSTIWSDGAEKVSGKNVYYITDGYGVAYFKRIGLGVTPDSNYVLKTSGAIYISGNTTHSGDITFSALGSIGESNKITWSGGTDAADIYYKLEANDQGALIFNMRDDSNTHFRWAYNKDDLISMDMNRNFYPNTDLSGSLGTSLNRWGSIYAGILRLQGPSSNPSATAGARIEFTYDDNTSRLQPVYISYTPNDDYRQPAGLKIFGGTNATPAWLEVEGDIYANKSIRNLEVGGGIYWNPYVESAADASDAASITVLKSGAAGGTELRISQLNDAADIINLVVNKSIYMNSKLAFNISDSWLRINETGGFSSGTYFGGTIVRTDYQFQVGDGGNKFYANNSGNGYFSNTLGIGGTNTGYRLYVNGTSYFTDFIRIPNNKSLIQDQSSTSNYTSIIEWRKGGGAGQSSFTYNPQVGQHNTGGADGSGSICVLPYATSTDPWEGSVGLYICQGQAKLDGHRLLTSHYATIDNGIKLISANSWISIAGISSFSCPDGTAITQPDGANPMVLYAGAASGRDCGIFYLSNDNAYIANSSDNAYTFGVFDTDITQNFSVVDNASLCVRSGGAGTFVRSRLGVNGTNDNYNLYVNGSGCINGRLDTCNRSNSASYMESALQIRERGFGGSQDDTWATAPRLSWHWGGRVQTQIGLGSNGELYLSKNNFANSYRLVYETGTWEININGSAAAAHRLIDQGTITAINGTSRYTSGLRIGRIYNSGYPFSYGVTLTMEASSFGAELIFNGLGGGGATGSGDMRFRTHSDWSTSEWGDWRTVLDTANYAGILDGRYINASGDTMTGNLTINATLFAGSKLRLWSDGEGGNIRFITPGNANNIYEFDNCGNVLRLYYCTDGGTGATGFQSWIWGTDGSFTAKQFNGYLNGNAASASLLKYSHTNEINFKGGRQSNVYFNYRNADDDSTGTSVATTYYFDSYAENNYGSSTIVVGKIGLNGQSSSYNLFVNGTSYLSGDLTIPNNHAYYGILGSNSSTTSSNTGGLTWFNLDGPAGAQVNVNDTPTSAWWYILRNRHTNTGNNYYTDIAIPFNDTSIYYKIVRNGSVVNNSWVKVLDTNNYSSYVFLPWALFRIQHAQSSGSSVYIYWGNNNAFLPEEGNPPSGSSNFSINEGNRSFINCPRTGYVRITVNLAVRASNEVNNCYLNINEYYNGGDHWKAQKICLGNIKTSYTTVSGSTIVYVRRGAYLQFRLESITSTTFYEDYVNPYWPHIILEYIT